MNIVSISKLWLKMSTLFDPIQKIFNGNFWLVFQINFAKFADDNIVDLACGTGELRNYIKPQKYLGIDINASYINFAKKRFHHKKNIKFMIADITNVAIPNNYQMAFLISATHHLADRQITCLLQNIQKSRIKQLIIIDGYPVSILANLLMWFDKVLAGGGYFRNEDQLVKIIHKNFTILEHGTFSANFSFYHYPYLIVKF